MDIITEHTYSTNHTKLNILPLYLFPENVNRMNMGKDRFGCTCSLVYPNTSKCYFKKEVVFLKFQEESPKKKSKRIDLQ